MSNKEYYWLNSHSRLFLERGYLEEGITPEKRIKQIADNAEKILGIKGFSEKFENYMKLGFYSLATQFGQISVINGDYQFLVLEVWSKIKWKQF